MEMQETNNNNSDMIIDGKFDFILSKRYPCYQLFVVSIEAALFCLHVQGMKCVDDSSRSEELLSESTE